MATTWSLSSSPPTSIFSCTVLIVIANLELETALAGGVGQGLDAPVVVEAAAVEDHRLHALVLGAGGDELADGLGCFQVGATLGLALALEVLVERRRRAEGLPRLVVDHLRVDVRLAAEHRQPRAPGSARDLLADAVLDPLPDVFFGLDLHMLFRTGRAGLARLLLEHLAHVADALLLVGIRLAQAADLRRHLAHPLAVDARHGHPRLLVHRHLDAD